MSLRCLISKPSGVKTHRKRLGDDRPFHEEDALVFPVENMYDRIVMPARYSEGDRMTNRQGDQDQYDQYNNMSWNQGSRDNMDEVVKGSSKKPSTTYNLPVIPRKLPDILNMGDNQVLNQEQHGFNMVVNSEYKTNAIKSEGIDKQASGEEVSSNSYKDGPTSSLFSSYSCMSKQDLTCNDLIYLPGPCTEAAIINRMKLRLSKNLPMTWVGPVLVNISQNAYFNNDLIKEAKETYLDTLLHRVLENNRQSATTQTVIPLGMAGSGKTWSCLVMLRRLLSMCGYGEQTDMFKHVEAAGNVIRPLVSSTVAGSDMSSRLLLYTECQMRGGSLHGVKLHPIFLEKSRLHKRGKSEGNFKIFHQMMAGMNSSEREQFELSEYTASDLNWMYPELRTNQEEENKFSFIAWKKALVMLGIPLSDIMRVFAAVILLGNIQFDLAKDQYLVKVARLLGVGPECLLLGLWKRTYKINGTLLTRSLDETEWQLAKTGLAGSLYMRTVYMVIRRMNSHHPTPTSSSARSADSGKSVVSVLLPPASSIGILDIFCWQSSLQSPCSLEQLCMNLCSERLQQLYCSVTIKQAGEAGRNYRSSYHCSDGAAGIDLISSPQYGLFQCLNKETHSGGDCQSLVASFYTLHRSNQALFRPARNYSSCFGIRHYTGPVVYDAEQFIDSNQDTMSDDLISMFHKSKCNSGFISHLYHNELKHLFSETQVPRAFQYRISPTSYIELPSGDEPSTNLCQDLHTKLDTILKSVLHSTPHFILCIKPNQSQTSQFDEQFIISQCRRLHLLETSHVMADGLPHMMKMERFFAWYRVISRDSENIASVKDLKSSCQKLVDRMKEGWSNYDPSIIARLECVIGASHVRFSEGARQMLERERNCARKKAAVRIQLWWRRRHRLNGTHPCDMSVVLRTLSLHGLDKDQPPPLPHRRSYTIHQDKKITFPQMRVLQLPLQVPNQVTLLAGQQVTLIGISPRPAHFLVQKDDCLYHVPYQYLRHTSQ